MTTEAEVWKVRYQTLRSAVVGVCGAAAVGGKSMTGRECIDLITASVKVIEDGGNINTEREAEGPQTEGEEPAVPSGGV